MDVNNLIEDNINLVYSTLHTYYPTFAYDEDLAQQGMLGLIYAAHKFDETKGVAFSTFAVKCIRNEFRKEFVRRCGEQKTVSIDGDEERSMLNLIGTSRDLDDSDLHQGYLEFAATLTDDERKILELRKNGASLDEIGSILGFNKANASKRMRRIKRLWRRWLENNDD